MTLNFIQHKFTVRPPADVDCVRELTDDEGLAENITLVAQVCLHTKCMRVLYVLLQYLHLYNDCCVVILYIYTYILHI